MRRRGRGYPEPGAKIDAVGMAVSEHDGREEVVIHYANGDRGTCAGGYRRAARIARKAGLHEYASAGGRTWWRRPDTTTERNGS